MTTPSRTGARAAGTKVRKSVDGTRSIGWDYGRPVEVRGNTVPLRPRPLIAAFFTSHYCIFRARIPRNGRPSASGNGRAPCKTLQSRSDRSGYHAMPPIGGWPGWSSRKKSPKRAPRASGNGRAPCKALQSAVGRDGLRARNTNRKTVVRRADIPGCSRVRPARPVTILRATSQQGFTGR